MKNKILFYSSVSDVGLFNIQGFYKTDIDNLNKIGFKVFVSNKIFSFFNFFKYDIGFFYFYTWSFFPALIARILGKKIFFTGGIDNLSLNKQTIGYFKQAVFFRLCYAISTKCIIVSTQDMENVNHLYHNSKLSKIEVSFHSIDIEKYLCPDIDIKEKYFCTIAWMQNIENVTRKGIDKAIYVFSELIKMNLYKDYLFYIIGTLGEGSRFLERICNNLSIQDKVIFIGNVSENKKTAYLQKSKYYFQLSTYEGFGIAALEALAAGNIVIHSGRGGLKDSMENDGIIVDINNNYTDLAVNIHNSISSFDDSKLRLSRNRLLKMFTNEKRISDLKRILLESGGCYESIRQ